MYAAKSIQSKRPNQVSQLREDPKGRIVDEVKQIPKEQLMVELVEHMKEHFFP